MNGMYIKILKLRRYDIVVNTKKSYPTYPDIDYPTRSHFKYRKSEREWGGFFFLFLSYTSLISLTHSPVPNTLPTQYIQHTLIPIHRLTDTYSHELT